MALRPITDFASQILKPYINNQDKAYAANIAPVETSPATSAHTAGTQIIYNGVLYDVTADINANDALATTGAGANIAAADDVSEQISNVKNALSDHWGTVNLFNKYLMADVATDLQYKTLTLKANTTYTASTDLPINSNNNANFFAYNSSGSANTNTNGLWQGQTRNITTGSDGIVIVAYRTVNFTNTSVEWFLSHNFQIEEGSTATSFQPYAKPNTELTQETKDLIDNAFANGAVNALENTAAATAVNGVTFIVNADKTVTVSTGAGGATANANLAINQTISESDIPKGTWVLSSGINDSNCYLSAMAYNGTTWVKNFGNTSQGDLTMNVDYSGYDTIRVYLVVVSGSIYTTSKTVKPMIAKAGFTDYVPHAMTNRELTELITNNITPSSYQYGSSKFSFCKCGKTIQFMGAELSADLPNGSWVDLIQLPDIYKPAIKYELNGFLDGNNPTDFYMFVITESGVVQLYRTSKNTSGVVIAARFSGSYIAAN